MNHKIIVIAGLLTIILMVSGASATTITKILSATNEPALNGVQVKVIYDDVAEQISVQYVANSAPVTNKPLGIDQVYFNLNRVNSVDQGSWTLFTGNVNAGGGFGKFSSKKNHDGGSYGGIGSPLVFTMSQFTLPITPNNKGATAAVHIRFDSSGSCSGWVSDATSPPGESEVATGCTPHNQIPEFPALSLPIAAVIGLVLFFRHRKEKRRVI